MRPGAIMRRISLLTLGGALLLISLQPLPSQAAPTAAAVHVQNRTLVFRAAVDATDDVSIGAGSVAGSIDVTDSAGVAAGAGCQLLSATEAMCSGSIETVAVMLRN